MASMANKVRKDNAREARHKDRGRQPGMMPLFAMIDRETTHDHGRADKGKFYDWIPDKLKASNGKETHCKPSQDAMHGANCTGANSDSI
jgi:hypothetical protein